MAEPTEAAGREQTLYGAYLAAVAFASAGSGLHHKICHVLGGMFGLPHAETHAVVLPHVLALNAPAVPELDRRMAAALGATTALDGLRGLRREIDAPTNLRDLGLTRGRHRSRRTGDPRGRAAEQPDAGHRRGDRGVAPRSLGREGAVMSDISAEQQQREEALVERVIASFAGTPDPRTKELVEALTRHLHAFLRETRLTEDEWRRAIDFLTAVGHITDDRRQEFILLSDVLGASMQTITINNEAYADATEATVFGPFFVEGSPDIGLGGDVAGGAPGEPCWVEGAVPDTDGRPLAGARLEVWEADADGLYDVQYGDDRVVGPWASPHRRRRAATGSGR